MEQMLDEPKLGSWILYVCVQVESLKTDGLVQNLNLVFAVLLPKLQPSPLRQGHMKEDYVVFLIEKKRLDNSTEFVYF